MAPKGKAGAAKAKGRPAGPKAKAAPREGQKKDWCFTLNNPRPEELAHIWGDEGIAYLVVGWETGDAGTPHFQGYLELWDKCRLSGVKDILTRAHWEARRGSPQQAADYCKKDGRWRERGTPGNARSEEAGRTFWQRLITKIQAHDRWSEVVSDPGLCQTVAGKLAWARAVFESRPRAARVLDVRTPGYHWQARFFAYLQTAPDDRRVVWVHCEDGNSGKSRFALWMACSHGALLGANDLRSDASLWDGQRLVIIDLMRSVQRVAYDSIEMYKSGVALQTKYEVCIKAHPSPHVLVFANRPPDMLRLSTDRWHIVSSLLDSVKLHDFFPVSAFPTVAGIKDPFDDEGTGAGEGTAPGPAAAGPAATAATPLRKPRSAQLALEAAEATLWAAESSAAAALLVNTPPAKKRRLGATPLPAKKSPTKDEEAGAFVSCSCKLVYTFSNMFIQMVGRSLPAVPHPAGPGLGPEVGCRDGRGGQLSQWPQHSAARGGGPGQQRGRQQRRRSDRSTGHPTLAFLAASKEKLQNLQRLSNLAFLAVSKEKLQNLQRYI